LPRSVIQPLLPAAFFNMFDSDKSGAIDFKEFICGLSVISRGSLKDRLDWALKPYVIDGDRKVSYEELLAILAIANHTITA
jgi:Ca2+-binding EF-hand superfamily protein